MKLQQLRYICEVARQNLNLSNAAEALFTSQPGISKQIRSLEEELGVDIFVRHGKRVVAVTEPGKAILEIAQRMLKDVENLRQVGEEFTEEDKGRLTIATTHTQARYALPQVIQRFTKRYPGVRLSPAPGQPDPDFRAGDFRGGRHRHRHRGDRAVRGSGDAALLRVEPLRAGATRASVAEGKEAHAGGDGSVSRSSPTILPSPAGRRSTRRLPTRA